VLKKIKQFQQIDQLKTLNKNHKLDQNQVDNHKKKMSLFLIKIIRKII
jgi:hypothetical protein